MDLDTTERAEVIKTGANSVPRGLAVDPINRLGQRVMCPVKRDIVYQGHKENTLS